MPDEHAQDLATARAIGNLEGTLSGIATTLVALDGKVDQSMTEGREATGRIETRLGTVENTVTAIGTSLEEHKGHDDERFRSVNAANKRQDGQLAGLMARVWDLAIKVAALGGTGYVVANQTGVIP